MKTRYFEKRLSNSLKNVYFCFQTLSLLMGKIIKNKRSLELGPVALQATKQVQKNSFISYVLSDQVWWCNIKWFFSYSKNYICKFMQANSWHHELFHFHLSFRIFKVWKGNEKNTKIWISRELEYLKLWHLSKTLENIPVNLQLYTN